MGIIQLSIDKNRRLQDANILSTDPILHPDRVMKEHDIVFITKGAWEVYEEDSCYSLTAGDILFLFAGRHHFGIKKFLPGTSWIYIHCYPNQDDRFFTGPSLPEAREVSVCIPSLVHVALNDHLIRGLFEEIALDFWSSSAVNRQKASVLFTELLLELSRRANREEHEVKVSPVRYAIDLIEKNPAQSFSLEYLAKKTGLDRRTLTRRFRSMTSMSIRQYQLQFKMRMARSLLLHNSTLPIKAVAAELGFADEFHFSRYFKKLVGLSPSVYRRENALATSAPLIS
jgi:AraC-like DNA-binding protein